MEDVIGSEQFVSTMKDEELACFPYECLHEDLACHESSLLLSPGACTYSQIILWIQSASK